MPLGIEECHHSSYHIQGDVLGYLNDDWDLIIAHPPCTYLSNAGAKHLYKGHKLNEERYKMGLEAKQFFEIFLNLDCPKVCVENPIPSTIFGLPKYNQIVQPYQFGHPFQKRTCLWLKGLPLLVPTNIVAYAENTRIAGNWFNTGGKNRQKNRAKTFEGLAEAMASQWSDVYLNIDD